MKWISYCVLAIMLIPHAVFASEPVTMSGPVPPISSSYLADSSNVVVYTLTNYVPEILPLTVGGISNVTGTQYAYILENGVIYCSINSNGTFNNCTPTTAPTNGVNHPHGIAFATFNHQYAYLADPNSSSLFQCTIDITNGNLSSCLEYTDGNIDAALGIAFNTDGSGTQHAYVADAATGMEICPVDAITGAFTPGCAPTPSLGPSWVPYGIAFTTAGGTRYAYVADNGIGANLGHVYRCLLNTDGTFKDNTCVATPTDTSSFASWNPSYIAFKTLNGVQYAYVVNNQSVNIGSIY